MSIDVKKAEGTGVTIQKDKLIALIRASTQAGFTIAREHDKDYVLIALSRSGTIER